MAERWFLEIDGIVGESTDADHQGEIDVQSWSWGVTHSGGSAGRAGGGAGKADFEDFHFAARISKASPQLFLACATGSHHKVAVLSGVRGAGKAKSGAYLTYKLSDVVVTSVHHGDTEANVPTEQFSLTYGKIEISYTPQSATGATGPPIEAGYDVKLNKKI